MNDLPAQPSTQPSTQPETQVATEARQLFRYLSGEEWQEYRSILAVFAGTFFAEFSPQEVSQALSEQGTDIAPEIVVDRLESLRRWGNLTVSSSVGNPASLDDYYRRRHRYLITRAGQEVYEVVEGVLQRIDDVSDVQAGRLRDLHRALLRLSKLIEQGLANVESEQVVDAVRGVFDPHETFSTEITQFFASINQWQSRFDLEPHEISFFAEVLVGYVSEQQVEIERMARPVAQALRVLEPNLEQVTQHARSGLAARVTDAGLADTISVRYPPGAKIEDWDHLMSWFGAGTDGRSRLDALTRQALAAVRTLTSNLTRLSRVGAGGASRRADFLKLARFVNEAKEVEQVHNLVSAAFGLFPARHFNALASDAEDPVATTTPWALAPRAEVPVTLRERGDQQQRGKVSPMRNRAMEREILKSQRQEERAAESATAAELLDAVSADGRVYNITVSTRALRRLRILLGASAARRQPGKAARDATDRDLHCRAERKAGESTSISCPEGTLTLIDLEVYLFAAHSQTTAHLPNQVQTQVAATDG